MKRGFFVLPSTFSQWKKELRLRSEKFHDIKYRFRSEVLAVEVTKGAYGSAVLISEVEKSFLAPEFKFLKWKKKFWVQSLDFHDVKSSFRSKILTAEVTKGAFGPKPPFSGMEINALVPKLLFPEWNFKDWSQSRRRWTGKMGIGAGNLITGLVFDGTIQRSRWIK